jgi:hypothetical protein
MPRQARNNFSLRRLSVQKKFLYPNFCGQTLLPIARRGGLAATLHAALGFDLGEIHRCEELPGRRRLLLR